MKIIKPARRAMLLALGALALAFTFGADAPTAMIP